MSDKPVKFEMPDGTLVSNDPDFDQEAAMAEYLDGVEYSGYEGASHEEELAQRQVFHDATLNSGQPGVGDNSVPDDVVRDAHGPLGSPAQQRQKEDMETAREAGATPDSTSVEDDEPVDSNEAVAKVREQRADREKAARQALIDEGEEPGDPDEPYSEWTAKQLKFEVAKRNAEEDRAEEEIMSLKGMKRADVAEMLEVDDERQKAIHEANPSGDQS